MKLKRVIAGFLSVALLAGSSVTAFASNPGDTKTNISEQIQIMPINDEVKTVKRSYYNAFSGTVKNISDFNGIKGAKFVSVENAEGAQANFIISKDTYILNNAEITVGSKITGFYEANAIMIMIYPPQYPIKVVVVGNQKYSIKVDLFDSNLISVDNLLKLNVCDDTEIITEDGRAFRGELANRKLVVMYTFSTRSIPAQTSPDKIVVLFEDLRDVSAREIIVNNQKIKAPVAYLNEEGIVMVPLRAIAQALGFDVSWNGELKSIMVGKGISLSIGKDYYTYLKTAPLQLGTAPALVQDTAFVPLSFFTKVVKLKNAYVSETQIIINNENGEKIN